MISENRCNSPLRLAAALLTALMLLSFFAGCAGGKQPEPSVPKNTPEPAVQTPDCAEPTPEPAEPTPETTSDNNKGETENMIYAYVNGAALTILPEKNSSAEALIELLKKGDITVEMHDYGSFEKVGALGASLPRNDTHITTEPGDVILYQGDQITIYYDVNSWSFTRLGRVQGVSQAELKSILGAGNAVVRFSLNAEC